MELSPCGEAVRRGDSARFRAALFAPPGPREHLFALYAFNLEIAKIAPMVSEPMLGEIRLQWWRETLDAIYTGAPVRRHEVALPLSEAIAAADLPRALFDALIDARASDLDPEFPESVSALQAYLAHTGGGLTVHTATALEPDLTEEGARIACDAGTAIGAARYLLAQPQFAAAGRKTLDGEAVRTLASSALERLNEARKNRRALSNAAAPALLEASAARFVLSRTAQGAAAHERSPFRERFSMLWRGATGRWW